MEPGESIPRNSASLLCSLAGRYGNLIPTRFLAPIDCLKIPAQYIKNKLSTCEYFEKNKQPNKIFTKNKNSVQCLRIYKITTKNSTFELHKKQQGTLYLRIHNKQITKKTVPTNFTTIRARNYRPCFRENQPKRSFSIK